MLRCGLRRGTHTRAPPKGLRLTLASHSSPFPPGARPSLPSGASGPGWRSLAQPAAASARWAARVARQATPPPHQGDLGGEDLTKAEMEAFQAGDYPTGAEEKELQAEAAAASAGLGDLCCDEAAAPPEAAVWQDAAEE